MQIDKVPVKSLTMDPANVRTHDDKNMKAIKASLNRFGQQKPIVVDANGVVVAGNGTLAAADALGWREISTVSTELNGAEAIAYAIADNRTAELADWDDESLAKQLSALQLEADELLEAAGFSAEELAALVNGVVLPSGEPQEEPVIDGLCLIEIRCSHAILDSISSDLEKMGGIDGCTIDVSR